MSGSGWNAADMSPTQVAEWKSDMERNMKFAMRLDQAISAIQGAVDSRVAHASEEKVKQMELTTFLFRIKNLKSSRITIFLLNTQRYLIIGMELQKKL